LLHDNTRRDRHLRFPLYLLYKGYDQLTYKQIDKKTVLNRKFCNFVYSNVSWADPFRDKFFHELSKYKSIDSGGRHLNNIGGPVPDKMTFIKDYKFSYYLPKYILVGPDIDIIVPIPHVTGENLLF
jgi:hypothetical protein